MENIAFKLGELFSGPGGLALGALRAEISLIDQRYSVVHEWANDFDPDACNTYRRNICGSNSSRSVICCDVRKLNLLTLPPIDAFAYGFPCNDFSVVGEQLGFDGSYGPLYSYGVEILNMFNPKFFIAENVGGLATANGGKAIIKILHELKHAGCGYKLTTHLYKSEYYAVPQTRHRIIIVGIRDDLKIKFEVPAPVTSGSYISAKQALENPPIPSNFPNHDKTLQSMIVQERLKYIKPGENAWTAELPKHLRLNVKNAKLSQIYKRLDPDKPSYTITGSGGGGTHCYHWSENRALTNRERARLQTFPDDFFFEGSKESVRKQIGMAVPPKLSQVIFEAVLKTFAGISYRSVPPSFNQYPEKQAELFEKVV